MCYDVVCSNIIESSDALILEEHILPITASINKVCDHLMVYMSESARIFKLLEYIPVLCLEIKGMLKMVLKDSMCMDPFPRRIINEHHIKLTGMSNSRDRSLSTQTGCS